MEQTNPQPIKKYRYAIIDTANSLMNDQYLSLLRTKGKANFDEWRDFALDILELFDFIKRTIQAEIVLVLGVEGTGKTVGGAKLNPSSTYWINADRKPLTFFGAKKIYNTNNKNYFEPKDYEGVKQALIGINNKKTEDRLIVFVLAHIDMYKGKDDTVRERMRTLGKMATKFNVEGAVTHCYYTFIDPNLPVTDPSRYKLLVHNTGFNTGRTPQGYFDDTEFISNDYRIIADKIYEDWGIEHREISEETSSSV